MASYDLPQVYEKPAYETLLAVLEGLRLQPPVWNRRAGRAAVVQEHESAGALRKADVTRYISTIVSSPLGWIADEQQRETLWDLAARRMSERCGRAAMGDIVRRWPFEAADGSVGAYEPFELVIREPALTGDSLGLKTWGASYLLAQQLPGLSATSLFRLFDESLGHEAPAVLELGSGTGLLGLAAAVLWKARVCVSDLPAITGNLKGNVDGNKAIVEARGGVVKVGTLTWGGGEDEVDQELFGRENQFKIVLAADPMYDDNHPALLASAIGQHLALGTESRAVVMVPKRDSTTIRLLEAFRQAMLDLDVPLFCVEEDELAGQDDWVGDDEGGHVRCWLGVFSRGGSPMSV
ncbi:S-adenosylmethionine-dependent methyltransferase-like protein [Metarhizium brunneum]